MPEVLKGLKPESVMRNFELLTQIPRGSGNEEAVSNFLVEFGKKLGLETYQDEVKNVYIKKPATKGYENKPGVVIQGHMDMVCEKEKNVEFDFEKDPIQLVVKDDMIYANGTTLGADNGIAVAMGMSVLEDDTLEHPAVEVFVTVNEESGMDGANGADPAHIEGKYIINIDSEEEGFITVSCAGGKNVLSTLPVTFEDVDSNKKAIEIVVEGLKGGHSGMEIVLQRANASKLLGRILHLLTVEYDLADIEGGTKHNAIPREANATILIDSANQEELAKQIKSIEDTFKNEFATADPGLKVSIIEATKTPEKVLSSDSKEKILQFILVSPHGVQTVSQEIEGLVESSANFAIMKLNENDITFLSSIRSSIISIREEIAERIFSLSKLVGATVTIESQYPAWEHAKDSKLEKLAYDVWKKTTGKDPEITAIHAGLECGILLDKLEGFEAISIGPDTFDVHTPNEHVSIKSIENVWNYLVELLKEIN
ncbi:MAG: aminoacyl-histidine dipeptidase [Clostridioides sp.]|jgi:dipeptidase D|nr:aminoacyl-histidine dipeptidase [Clostridioides sp.]